MPNFAVIGKIKGNSDVQCMTYPNVYSTQVATSMFADWITSRPSLNPFGNHLGPDDVQIDYVLTSASPIE